MINELIINATATQTRIVRMEGGLISDLIVERARESGFVGNIYKGKVVRVLPGMQAAFAEIGLERTAFLYVSDISPDLVMEEVMRKEGESKKNKDGRRSFPQIQNLVKEGQEVLVQVTRDPLGTKGARLTSHVSLPGRFLVYMPTIRHTGVSRRISSDEERIRLKNVLRELSREFPGGFIARTLCEGASPEDIRQDMECLVHTWEQIEKKGREEKSPALIHGELSLVLRSIRDLYSPNIDRIVVDSVEEKENIQEFIRSFSPGAKNVVELYEGEEPIFDFYGIEIEISRALGKKVWLKSGGYIIIDQAEALVAIDVNTGKFVGKRNLEDTILKTNLEAAKEIAYQLRLRNLGGIIIVDFIDMARHSDREKVYQFFKEELSSDRAKTSITKITDLGLVEMTRERNKESLTQLLCETCIYCEGRGYLKSRSTVCHEIFRELHRRGKHYFSNSLLVEVHPTIAEMLLEEEHINIEEWEKVAGKKVTVQGREDFHLEQYEIVEE